MRLRVTFSKSGALRYTSHLDLLKIWERTARRAALPLAYSHGFHPQPKIQLAAALPLGFSGQAEIVDLWLESDREVAKMDEQLQLAAPPGLAMLKIEKVEEQEPALQQRVAWAEYSVCLLDAVDMADLQQRISTILKAATLPRERRGKSYDLRPLIQTLYVISQATPEGRVCLQMCLAAQEGATGRPEEVLAELGIPHETTRIERTRLIFKANPVE